MERLSAIETIGRLAVEHGMGHVLVAGDVYDSEAPLGKTLREPVERMRRFRTIVWHLIPSNHDPHRPNGVWHRVRQEGLPPNVIVHVEPALWARRHSFCRHLYDGKRKWPSLSATILRLKLKGALSLSDRALFEKRRAANPDRRDPQANGVSTPAPMNYFRRTAFAAPHRIAANSTSFP